jgi:hypothetical protein
MGAISPAAEYWLCDSCGEKLQATGQTAMPLEYDRSRMGVCNNRVGPAGRYTKALDLKSICGTWLNPDFLNLISVFVARLSRFAKKRRCNAQYEGRTCGEIVMKGSFSIASSLSFDAAIADSTCIRNRRSGHPAGIPEAIPIGHARIELTDAANKKNGCYSDSTGHFHAAGIGAGTYKVTAAARIM